MKTVFLLLSAALFSIPLLSRSDDSDKHRVTPVIVAHRSFVSQTTALATTTLFTPQKDGDFRLSAYLEVPPAQTSGGAYCVGFAWTDDLRLRTDGVTVVAQFAAPPADSQTFGQTVAQMHAKGGTPITAHAIIQPPGFGCAAPQQSYSLFVTIEEIPTLHHSYEGDSD